MHQITVKVERVNRTFLERVRSMMTLFCLSKKLRGEAIVTAVYLINRSFSMPLKGKIPKSVYVVIRLIFSNLKVFCCTIFVHQNGHKL